MSDTFNVAHRCRGSRGSPYHSLQSKGECIAMIAREWKCRVPEARSEGFTGYLYETGIKDSSATPGFLGAQIFRRSLAAKIELTLITYWDNLESIKAFAGNDISQARLYPEDEVYEIGRAHV